MEMPVKRAERVASVSLRGKTLNRVNLNVNAEKESDKEFPELWPLIKEVMSEPRTVAGGLLCGVAVVVLWVLGAVW